MILTVIGARPQFVKAAVLSNEFKKQGIRETIIHTGQHYDYKMSEVFFEELGLPGAAINLNIGSGSHGVQTAEMLIGIEKVLIEERERMSAMLLYGDTNSTLAGALAAAKLNIPIIHVEAGLRSFNKTMPEEVNRITTDHLSDILFCSSDEGKKQLAKEGIVKEVHISGDIMLDAFNIYSSLAEKKVKLGSVLPENIINNYCLLTIHRPANTDNDRNLQEILLALGNLNYSIVWPIHPRNKSRIGQLRIPSNVHLFDPFSYFEMMVVLRGAKKVITDSGGLQKEAYWAKRPCITIRPETEWIETLHNQWNILSEPASESIIEAVSKKIDDSTWIPLYGKGDAAVNIAATIKQQFSK
jgi:UDP-N-acetylglucosamine 2-epimerase